MAEQRVGNFYQQELYMTLRALTRHESERNARSLLEHAKGIGISLSLPCFGALLTECEQRGLLEHEIAHLKGLEGTACKQGMEMGFGAAVKCAIAMHLVEIYCTPFCLEKVCGVKIGYYSNNNIMFSSAIPSWSGKTNFQ